MSQRKTGEGGIDPPVVSSVRLFPEVFPDPEFHEDKSTLVLGPIHKQRWIYACAKQRLDRVIWAFGQQGDLEFTLIRPFNWIGPRLDSIETAKEGSSRVVTQFVINLFRGEPIRLEDGGVVARERPGGGSEG